MRYEPLLLVDRPLNSSLSFRKLTIQLKVQLAQRSRPRHFVLTADLPIAIHSGSVEASTAADSQADPNLAVLIDLEELSISSFQVIGGLVRYAHNVRTKLVAFLNSILNSLAASSDNYENYVLWAPPGTGKTFMIESLHSKHKEQFDYFYFNGTKQTREDFEQRVQAAKAISGRPVLCFFDELDGEVSSSWACEAAFNMLRLNSERPNQQIVCVIGGSASGGLDRMMELIRGFQNKGSDLIDCIGRGTGYKLAVPELDAGDKILLFAKTVLEVRNTTAPVLGIEKLALYRLLLDKECLSARGVVALARLIANNRLAASENRITLSHMFERDDPSYRSFARGLESVESVLKTDIVSLTLT
ncbi:MAG: AAA family ATPase [Verrucomicrobiales bacterium]|nr:AAA family ATPase [Verrucomicrobiales bacterium]